MTAGTAKRWLRVGAAAYAALLAVLSLLPSGQGRLGGWDEAVSPGLQNVLHVPAYAALAVLVWLGLGRRTVGWLVLVAAGSAAFGAGLEFAQAAIPGRMGSIMDAGLNAVGVVLGVAGVLLANQARRARRGSPAEEGSEGG